MSKNQEWQNYEQVAVYVCEQIKDRLGLKKVEGKQEIIGVQSGMKWTVDGKGICEGNEGFLFIEVRRQLTSGQKPEQLGGLAYRIRDTGASGGIMVSPLPIQEGAKKIAEAEKIYEITLHENSTCESFIAKFLNDLMVGARDNIHVCDEANVEIVDPE
jgi:hypothetical protein